MSITRHSKWISAVAALGAMFSIGLHAQSVSQYASGWTASVPDWTPMPPSPNPLGPPNSMCVGTSNAGEVWAQFSFPSLGIPAGDSVVGIEVNVNYGSVVSPTMQLFLGGVPVGDPRPLPSTPPAGSCDASVVRTAGGPADTWNAGLTVANFNAAGTVAVRLTRVTGLDMPVSIDIESVQIVVHHQGANNDPDCGGASIPSQNADASCQATISSADVSGVTDPDGDDLTIMVNPTLLSLGSNNVNVSADDGRGGSCSEMVNVDVVDVTPPILALLGANPLTLECGIDSYSDSGATADDNCDTPTVMVGGDTVDPNTVGSYLVTYDASDSAGNPAIQITRTVNVVDTTAPVITLNGDAMVTLECGVDAYTELGATASDACDPSVPVTIGGDVVDPGTPGTYTVTYDATDDEGNPATQATRTVVVQDTLPPVIACNSQSTIVPPDAPISFTSTAEDACDGPLTPETTEYTCFWTNPSGRVVDKTNSCVVSFEGPTLNIDDSGGVKDTIQWNVSATDSNGNEGTESCSVLVVNPGHSALLFDPFEVEFPLEGGQVIPNTGSEASGYCHGRFNASRSRLDLGCEYDVAAAAMRLNHGLEGQNGEKLLEISEGRLQRRLDLSASTDDLYEGKLYLTVPSESFPEGEIRGQIPAPPRILGFAQFGGAEGLESELALHNPSRVRRVKGYVSILDETGVPVAAALSASGSADPAAALTEFELPPLGGMTLRSNDLAGFRGGSAVVVSNGVVDGLVRFTIPGLGTVSAPGLRPMDEAIATVRCSPTLATGVAVQNLEEGPITLQLSLRDGSGAEVPNGSSTLVLKSGARSAQFLTALFPEADLDSFLGELVIRAQGGSFSAMALELGRGAGALSTLPITAVER